LLNVAATNRLAPEGIARKVATHQLARLLKADYAKGAKPYYEKD
jgi:hypothetical protein